jgi:hypothetical protein
LAVTPPTTLAGAPGLHIAPTRLLTIMHPLQSTVLPHISPPPQPRQLGGLDRSPPAPTRAARTCAREPVRKSCTSSNPPHTSKIAFPMSGGSDPLTCQGSAAVRAAPCLYCMHLHLCISSYRLFRAGGLRGAEISVSQTISSRSLSSRRHNPTRLPGPFLVQNPSQYRSGYHPTRTRQPWYPW